MLSSASRQTDRFAAAAGALLLQMGFIAAFLYALPLQTPSRQLEHELTFFLPRLPRVAPPKPAAAAPPRALAPTLTAPPPLINATPLPTAPTASQLQNFGWALTNCAPENYASLTPQQKSLCARPGEGMAIRQDPDPLHPPHDQAKDEAYWQEHFTRDRMKTVTCPPNASLAGCLIDEAIADRKEAQDADQRLADAKAASLREPKPPLPEHIGSR